MYGKYKYGVYKYSEEGVPDGSEIEEFIPDLMKYLPWYYQQSEITKEIQNSIAKEFGIIAYYIEDINKQFFIDTATWGLGIYEKELGLKTNLNLSYEERREIIIAKMRGYGTTTKAMIKNTAESFSGGEVDVIEYPAEYRFIVKFVGILGIPRNMQAFIDMLEAIKPAHLTYSFEYTYTIWDSVKPLTWEQASAKTWRELRIYEGE